MKEYTTPTITTVGGDQSVIHPDSCTIVAVVLALVYAAAGAYVAAVYAYAAAAAVAVAAAAVYATVGTDC